MRARAAKEQRRKDGSNRVGAGALTCFSFVAPTPGAQSPLAAALRLAFLRSFLSSEKSGYFETGCVGGLGAADSFVVVAAGRFRFLGSLAL